jgi:SAM-dependent methyltransferase/uncharacterized protein YbaR (Trm112 family)
MQLRHFHAFAPICPLCARQTGTQHALTLAAVRAKAEDRVHDGILRCTNRTCGHEYPILDGIPVIVPDVARYLSERAVEIVVRDDIDPVMESLLGDAIGPESWFDSMRQAQSTYGWDSYGGLDPEPDQGTPGAAAACLERLLALAGAPAPGNALDLGCAAGGTSFALAAHHPAALVLGIDVNLGLLRMARRAAAGDISFPRRRIGLVYDRRRFKAALSGADRVDFWAADALALPFPPACVGLVAALNLLDCVPDPAALLAAMQTALAPGGQMLLATPYDWSSRATAPPAWIGGHSQRAAYEGRAETLLRDLLTEGAHPRAVPGLTLIAEQEAWPWRTRLHERSTVDYTVHLLALRKTGA